jgi:uncharacterized integral membrane protein
MTSQQPVPTGTPEDPSSTAAGAPGGPSPAAERPSATPPQGSQQDPLRGSRTSGIWAAVIALVLVLVLTAIFILQNTQQTEVNFLGWSGSAPVSAALLIAAAGGALIVAAAGMLRILQLRRRVKRERKRG